MQRVVRAIQAGCDGWLWWAYYPATCAMLLGMTLFTRWYAAKVAGDWEQWVVADWLASYAAGFVRRGLSGELLLGIARAVAVPPNLVVWWTIVAIQVVFAAALAALLWRKRQTFWHVVMSVSPASMLFALYNPAAVGRKEGLLLAAFAVWALVLAARPLTRSLAIAFGAAAFALTLMHEVFAFYAPYFPLLASLTAASSARGHAGRWAALVPVGSLAGLVLALSSSVSLDDPALCDALQRAGGPAKVCEGLFEYRQLPAGDALAAGLALAPEAIATVAVAAIAIVLAPLMCFALATVEAPDRRRGVLAGCAGALLWSAPLFLVAVDWGRWIAIHAAMTTVLAAALLPARGARPPWPGLALPPLAAAAAGVLLLASMLTWTPKYCCGEDLLAGYTPLEAIRDTWVNFEF